jgi:hypothetical protein
MNREVRTRATEIAWGLECARKKGSEAMKSGGETWATEIAWGLECRRMESALSRQRTTSCVNDRQLRADGQANRDAATRAFRTRGSDDGHP